MAARYGRRRSWHLIVLLGIPCCVLPFPAIAADEDARLTVVVCDSAAVPPATLAEALREASRIFRKAGLETQWLGCSASHVAEVKDVERDTSCHRPRDPARIVLEIFRTPSRGHYRAGEAAGFARLPSDGTPSVCAGVFYDRAEVLARWGDASKAQILACLTVHEIGHVLLGSGAHAAGGIMRPELSRGNLRRAAWGLLGFEPWQAEQLRSGLLARATRSLVEGGRHRTAQQDTAHQR